MLETWVQSLSQEDPLEKEMATRSSVLAWEILWTGAWWATVHGVTENIGYDLATKQQQGVAGFLSIHFSSRSNTRRSWSGKCSACPQVPPLRL